MIPIPAKRGKGRILVVRGGAIGDFVVTLPVLAALREQFPDSSLEIMAYPKVAQLAGESGLVDRILPIEARALAGFFARKGDLDPALSEYFQGIHQVISFLFDPDGFFRQNIARVSKARFIQGVHRPDDSSGIPASRQFLKALEMLAIFDADPVPKLHIPALPRKGSGPLLGIHPGSGGEQKNWPLDRWEKLARELSGAWKGEFLVVGGEADGSRIDRVLERLPRSRTTLLRDAPLIDVARALAPCTAFVGHDSGISHIAAAQGVRGFSLWGPSAHAVWRPLNPQWDILTNDRGLEGIEVSDVLGRILGELTD